MFDISKHKTVTTSCEQPAPPHDGYSISSRPSVNSSTIYQLARGSRFATAPNDRKGISPRGQFVYFVQAFLLDRMGYKSALLTAF